MSDTHRITAILPCRDLDRSQAFYERLGLACTSDYGDYRILSDGNGWHLHLTAAQGTMPTEHENPYGLYIYAEDVDVIATRVRDLIIGPGPESKPWGTYEFALSDPDGTLVRIGQVIS